MKYRFGRNRKQLNSEQIKSQMNFEQVATGAKAFAGAKLVSGMLKSGISVPGAVAVGAVTTVAALVIVVPQLQQAEKQPQPEPVKTEIVAPTEKVDSLQNQELIIEQTEEPVAEVPAAKLPKSEKVIGQKEEEIEEQPVIAPQPNEPIENRDVFIRARPLPDLESFKAFISSELKYPEEARKDSVHGFVRVYFEVNQQGLADNFKINKSLGEVFDNEAVRVLKMYQNWEPASFNGQAVESLFQINIQFEFKKPYPKDTIRYY